MDKQIDWAAAHETNAKCRKAADPLAAWLFPKTPYLDKLAQVAADIREARAEEAAELLERQHKKAQARRFTESQPSAFGALPLSAERIREIGDEEEACEHSDAARASWFGEEE